MIVSRASIIPTARGSHSPTTKPAAARCSTTRPAGRRSTFDADGRLSVVVNPAGLRLTYAYDAASQRKYLIEPEGARFTYVFDADGRTSYVANPQAQRATYSYDAASRVTGIHFANTTRASYLYDNADRLLRVANLTSTNTTLSSFSYALDAVGNRMHVVESTGNRVTWTYDNTYQLKNEQRSGSNCYNITYTYDPVGNRLTEINGGVRTTSTYDAANELTKTQVVAGITTITYDANGNLLSSRNPSNQRTSYTWDFENRLTQVALPTGDRGHVHLQRRRPARAEAGLDRHDQARLGRAEHLAGNRRKQYHSGGLHAAAGALRQLDLATAERDNFVLPVRRAGLDNATGEQHGVGNRQLPLRFVREHSAHVARLRTGSALPDKSVTILTLTPLSITCERESTTLQRDVSCRAIELFMSS